MSNTHTAYITVRDEEGSLTREEWCEVLEQDIEEMFHEVEEVEVVTAP